MSKFIAIDFETADYGRDSACAVGLARVEGGRVAGTAYRLIRPPRSDMRFTDIHGITWEDVEKEPPFGEGGPERAGLVEGGECIAAQNAPFDKSGLDAGGAAAGREAPPQPFSCT